MGKFHSYPDNVHNIYNTKIYFHTRVVKRREQRYYFHVFPPSVDDILCLNLSSWMNSKVTRTVTLTKQNQKRLWKNLTKRSGRQIKASMRFDLR